MLTGTVDTSVTMGPKCHFFGKIKMAAVAILESTQKGIYRPIRDQYAPNFVC